MSMHETAQSNPVSVLYATVSQDLHKDSWAFIAIPYDIAVILEWKVATDYDKVARGNPRQSLHGPKKN